MGGVVTLVLILWFWGTEPVRVRLDYPSFEACYGDLIDAMKVDGVSGYCDDSPIVAENQADQKDHANAPKTK